MKNRGGGSHSLADRILTIEDCVDNLCRRFTGANGASAFNYHTERDLQCELVSCLRRRRSLSVTEKDGVRTDLVHSEWRVLEKNGNASRRLRDIAIWGPAAARTARKNWGKSSRDLAEKSPIQIAIEIRHLYGASERGTHIGLNKISTVTQIVNDDDIRKLLMRGIKFGYFLAFLDDDLEDSNRPERARKLRDLLRKVSNSFDKVLCKSGNRTKVLIVSRDGFGMQMGFTKRLSSVRKVPDD